MVFPDVNVLIYAFRSDSPHHQLCRQWLDRLTATNAAIACSKQTLASVIRITTNRRAYREPSSLDEAIGFCEDILAYRRCRLIETGNDHWTIFTNLLRDTNTTGPTVTDAWLAALAIEWNCEFVTLDHDFARFPRLRWSKPE